MPIFKVLIPTEDTVQTTCAIEYDGSFWIVPGWLVQSTGLQKPARIVRVDHIRRIKESLTAQTRILKAPDTQFVNKGRGKQAVADLKDHKLALLSLGSRITRPTSQSPRSRKVQ